MTPTTKITNEVPLPGSPTEMADDPFEACLGVCSSAAPSREVPQTPIRSPVELWLVGRRTGLGAVRARQRSGIAQQSGVSQVHLAPQCVGYAPEMGHLNRPAEAAETGRGTARRPSAAGVKPAPSGRGDPSLLLHIDNYRKRQYLCGLCRPPIGLRRTVP